MKFDLQLIRHGQTDAVKQQVYCGYTDMPLNQEGIKEIEGFIADNMYDSAEIHYSSGLKRAIETLQLIEGYVDWIEIPELKEYNFGDFEMRKHDELLSETSYNEWISDQTGDYIVPNGESVNLFNMRVEEGFQKLFRAINQTSNKSIMLTSHGGVIAQFIRRFHDPDMNIYEAMPSHGRGYRILAEYANDTLQIDQIKVI